MNDNFEQSAELQSIKILLQRVVDKQDDMDDMLKSMDKTLTQLNQTVIGNATYGQKGLVNEIAEVKEYVEKDKMFKNKIAGGLVVIGVVWTFFLQYFGKIFSVK